MEKELGTFIMESDVARISDPCYDKGIWCAGLIGFIKLGTWKSKIVLVDKKNWGTRVSELHAVHENFVNSKFKFKEASFSVGVDSGQAGILFIWSHLA